jgi:ketosteroid isomerase-like protein
MPGTNLDLIRGAYEAFSRGDVPAVLGILSDDVRWTVPLPLPQAVEARGHEEVGRFFERLVGTWEGLDLELEDFVASGDHVCVIGRGRGRVDGQQASYRFVHCWTIDGDRAVRFDEFAQPGPELL